MGEVPSEEKRRRSGEAEKPSLRFVRPLPEHRSRLSFQCLMDIQWKVFQFSVFLNHPIFSIESIIENANYGVSSIAQSSPGPARIYLVMACEYYA